MRRRAKQKPEAEASARIFHTVTPEYPDPELGHFRRGPYSIWSGVKHTLVLSVILWWLPTFGQMIAGYIGGRRAGGPWRGVIAAVIPVVLIVILAWGSERGILGPWLTSVIALPTAIGHTIAAIVPPLSPYIEFVLGYLAAFAEALKGTLAMGSNGYLVTIVFAYIGGVLADQTRRETRTPRGTSVGISIAQPFFEAHRPFATWDERHSERFEDLRRIPVNAATVEVARHRPAARTASVAGAHKVDARRADAGPQEAPRVREDTKAKPERKESGPHDKEAATRRFVERALRQYEASHRR